ncbi:hypothetical protein OJ997_20815 [Solirubrobacter phytolaccae]|uniref:Uncharacterized protein n=1 Tax=Solirubrobacter phytolaccae TaxID=1404360 RepID=A0A9X3NDB4_9ACTN|nr:hypothetical protein [Solirubrobacter phytolaccae]MDA0182767.1 hypothetical protein [Solirubrobacter phytolaccae]
MSPPRDRVPNVKLRWAATALVVVAAAVAGFVASKSLVGGLRDDTPETESEAPRVERDEDGSAKLGRLHVQADSGWTRVGLAPEVPGFPRHATIGYSPYPGLNLVAVANLAPAEDGSLLPEALRKDAPKPTSGRLGGVPAWFYRGLSAGKWRLDAAVLPTTRGVVTVACAVQGSGSDIPVACLDGVRGVSVDGAESLPPSRAIAFQVRLPEATRELDTTRVADRTAIRRAKTPAGQSRAAGRLRTAHLEAAAQLSPLAADAPGGEALVKALRTNASAYGDLQRAAERKSRRAWTRARTRVRRTEAALTRALEAVAEDAPDR